jgi:hypothetical protein
MNRKLALAASVSASTVLVAGALMVGVLLSQGPEPTPTPDLAMPAVETDSSSVTSLDPVVVYEDQYELVVTGSAPVAAPSATEDGGGGAPTVPTSVVAAAPAPAPAPAPVATVGSSTTVAPKAATTTTTWPTGVPRDWPADKPIPPMPANCRQPQLEDNGVWNCQG